ncbi:hypothetical protein E2C01_022728 [Portunus trituberculatus]|uniref:Uncharacterized protein n=1 Tax=Portunus trituberculatus TaxID=210409 RepID=A0A5B7E657_PORTR|nr:hypothetical protein [Portunus trituberculatus]
MDIEKKELPIQRPDPEEILRHLYHQDQDQDREQNYEPYERGDGSNDSTLRASYSGMLAKANYEFAKNTRHFGI